VTPQSGNRVATSLGNSGLCLIVFARNRDTAVPAEGNGDWSVSLWRNPDDVPHCPILSPDNTEWRLMSATLCGWRRCFIADQLWFMTRIREEQEEFCVKLDFIYIFIRYSVRKTDRRTDSKTQTLRSRCKGKQLSKTKLQQVFKIKTTSNQTNLHFLFLINSATCWKSTYVIYDNLSTCQILVPTIAGDSCWRHQCWLLCLSDRRQSCFRRSVLLVTLPLAYSGYFKRWRCPSVRLFLC